MMIFETEEQQRREKKAIEAFVKVFGGSYQKLDPMDVDYKIFDKSGNLIAYAEVVARFRSLRDAYPLPIEVSKLSKLVSKRLNPVVIWSCDDGIMYAKVMRMYGDIRWTTELMAYYDKQKEIKYIRFS